MKVEYHCRVVFRIVEQKQSILWGPNHIFATFLQLFDLILQKTKLTIVIRGVDYP